MATVSPDLHDTSPAATDPAPAPYTVPPRTVRTLIGPGVEASHAYERTHLDALRDTAALILAYVR